MPSALKERAAGSKLPPPGLSSMKISAPAGRRESERKSSENSRVDGGFVNLPADADEGCRVVVRGEPLAPGAPTFLYESGAANAAHAAATHNCAKNDALITFPLFIACYAFQQTGEFKRPFIFTIWAHI